MLRVDERKDISVYQWEKEEEKHFQTSETRHSQAFDSILLIWSRFEEESRVCVSKNNWPVKSAGWKVEGTWWREENGKRINNEGLQGQIQRIEERIRFQNQCTGNWEQQGSSILWFQVKIDISDSEDAPAKAEDKKVKKVKTEKADNKPEKPEKAQKKKEEKQDKEEKKKKEKKVSIEKIDSSEVLPSF